MKYLLKLSYLGERYCGFQVQPGGNTVQAELGRAAEKIFSCLCDINGCSRTDSGVHALEYYATAALRGKSSRIACENIPRAINTYLPDDISVSAAFAVNSDFSVRRAVQSKEYLYLIWNGAQKNPFFTKRACFYPNALNIDLMNRACERFVGRHDYAAFMTSGSGVCNTTRTVYECSAARDGDFVKVRIRADGFLYNMVRIITGTLLEVSEGKIGEEALADIIERGDRTRAGRTAPAHGLYLNRIWIDF